MFGRAGQERIRATEVAVVGVGGLGTHVIQQLALLGVGRLALIDPEEIDETNRNRYVGILASDAIPGSRKVDLGERLVRGIDPEIGVTSVAEDLVSQVAFDTLKSATHVFGCLDSDGARLILNEFCSAYSKPYIDLASDVIPGDTLLYGGRIVVNFDGTGCLACLDELDAAEAGSALSTPSELQDRRAIYGVDADLLARAGPSVVSINGVVASLAVTEFMVTVTELRAPQKLLAYYGHEGTVRSRVAAPSPTCWYCRKIRGQGARADVERYLTF